jgi:hypothetical protein
MERANLIARLARHLPQKVLTPVGLWRPFRQ